MAPLNPHRAVEPQDSERTLATVLFTDIVGSTQRAVELGDRRWRELLERHEGVVTREIEGFGGRIVDTAGDGVFAVFAAPAQAVRCAGAICRSVRTLGLEVRTGVHTGECEVRGERLAGLAVHIGARIGALAGPGQVLVSHTVRDLVLGSEIRFAERGPHALKGIPGEWRLFEACDETEADAGSDTTGADVAEEEGPLPLPASVEATKPGSLLGRDSHLALLEQHLDTTRAGSRRFVFLAGEPGIGKTRLAEEFARHAHAGGATVLHGRCFEEALVSYEPLITALRQYVTACPAVALREQIGRAGPDLARLVPELRDRLPDLPEPVSADPEGDRFRLFEAVRELLTRASAATPLVLVLDDLHWADKPTMLVLRHLARSPEQSKLLVLGTYRDPDPGATHVVDFLAELRRERRGERIALSGLREQDVVSLVSDQSGHRPLERVVRLLHEQTDGNPFFLEELVRHLTEAGILETAEQEAALEAAGIPDVVSDVIARRVARLSDAAQETLAAASVVGRDFALDLVDRVTDLGEEWTIGAIEDALRAGIVVEVPAVPDGYSFTHALIRDTLYRAIKTSRRIRLHRRVAEALEELCGDDPGDRLAEIAHHFSEAAVAGEGAAKAIAYSQRAAMRAMDGLAYEEAAGHYTRALRALERAPAGRHDQEVTPCRLNEGLGEALSITGRHAEATAAFSRALDHVPDDEPLTRARLLRKMSHSLETQRRYDEAMSASIAAEQAIDVIRAEPECERELLQICLDRMPLHYWQGQVEEMVALLETAGPLVDRIGTPTQRAAFSTGSLLMAVRRDRYAIPDDTLAIARAAAEAADESDDVNVMGMPRFNLGFCHLWRGELDEAEEHIREAVVLAERTGNMTVKSRALVYLTIVYRRRGDVDAVERLAAQTLEVSEAGEMLEYVATSRANQGWVHWKRGDLDAAAEAAGAALRGWDALPTSFAYAFRWTALWPLMAVALARNEPDEAATCAQRLLDPTHQVLPAEVIAPLERAATDGASAAHALEAAMRLGID